MHLQITQDREAYWLLGTFDFAFLPKQQVCFWASISLECGERPACAGSVVAKSSSHQYRWAGSHSCSSNLHIMLLHKLEGSLHKWHLQTSVSQSSVLDQSIGRSVRLYMSVRQLWHLARQALIALGNSTCNSSLNLLNLFEWIDAALLSVWLFSLKQNSWKN